MQYSRIRCPQCRSNSLRIYEIWNSQIEHIQVDGLIDIEKGEKEHLNPIGLTCNCQCGHIWTVRNATQINDILSPAADKVA